MPKLNWTTIALIGGLLLLILVIAFFATGRNADQDKLTNGALTTAGAPSGEKLCASKTTYDLIKRELFRRAAELRGSDQAAFDKLSAYAALRMENPVMESEDNSTHAVNCSGSLSLDLPPGVAAVGGRRSLMSDVDYVVQPAADGSGTVVMLRNADAIIAPLATLARTTTTAPAQTPGPGAEPVPIPAPGPGEEGTLAPPAATPPSPQPEPSARANPSFNCANARTRGEVAVCRDSGLAALDRQMAAQYGSAMSRADPGQRALLQSTRSRFLGFRDNCRSDSCIADAYRGRMREISDIMAGRWTPPR
ncbi:MAG: hypothetical protein V4502_13470 [Pseudomonadota bacterium]